MIISEQTQSWNTALLRDGAVGMGETKCCQVRVDYITVFLYYCCNWYYSIVLLYYIIILCQSMFCLYHYVSICIRLYMFVFCIILYYSVLFCCMFLDVIHNTYLRQWVEKERDRRHSRANQARCLTRPRAMGRRIGYKLLPGVNTVYNTDIPPDRHRQDRVIWRAGYRGIGYRIEE